MRKSGSNYQVIKPSREGYPGTLTLTVDCRTNRHFEKARSKICPTAHISQSLFPMFPTSLLKLCIILPSHCLADVINHHLYSWSSLRKHGIAAMRRYGRSCIMNIHRRHQRCTLDVTIISVMCVRWNCT